MSETTWVAVAIGVVIGILLDGLVVDHLLPWLRRKQKAGVTAVGEVRAIPEKPCLSCGETMQTTLKVVQMHDGGKGLLHPCGTIFTREFMRDHYGIEWTEAENFTWAD